MKQFEVKAKYINSFEQVQVAACNALRLTLDKGKGFDSFYTCPYLSKVGTPEFEASNTLKWQGIPASHALYCLTLNAVLNSSTASEFTSAIHQAFSKGLQYFKIIASLKPELVQASGKSAVQWASNRAKSELQYKLKQIFELSVFTYASGNDQSHATPKSEVGKGKYSARIRLQLNSEVVKPYHFSGHKKPLSHIE